MKIKKYGFALVLTALVVSISGCVKETTDNYFQIDQSQYKSTFNELRTDYVYKAEANQSGDVKVLVVPVELKGYLASSLPAGREGTREQINNVVFGASPSEDPTSEVQWESLKSFYYKSSYEQCNIEGYTTDWWYVDQSPTQFKSGASVQGLIGEINDYYRSGADENVNPKDFDANGDGYIDLVILVYSCKQKVLGQKDDVFWAYCTQSSTSADFDNPNISRYIWLSQNFMFENGYWEGNTHKDWTSGQIANREAKLDAHTFIHEVGHGLGLADYYSYDDGDISAMGKLDMMDYNVGDHNAYSKALYGWISPYVVEGRATITIDSFQNTGDSIIVPIRSSNWKETTYSLLDEYLILEYDTIDNLVVFDSLHKYANAYPIWFSQAGVRVIHVDSRIGVFSRSSHSFLGYTKKSKIENDANYVYFAHDNTLSRTARGNRLAQVMSKSGSLMTMTALNSDLFVQGDSFGYDTFSNFKMNSGAELGFKFQITEMNETSCTIDFYVA